MVRLVKDAGEAGGPLELIQLRGGLKTAIKVSPAKRESKMPDLGAAFLGQGIVVDDVGEKIAELRAELREQREILEKILELLEQSER